MGPPRGRQTDVRFLDVRHGMGCRTASGGLWPDKDAQVSTDRNQRDIRRCGREVACAPLDQGPPPPKTPVAICSASFHLCISPVPFHRLDPLIVEVKDAGAKWHAARMGIAGWCCGWRNFVCVSNACPERDEGPRVTAVILERVPLRRRIEIQNAPSEIRVGCNLHFRPDILRGLPWSSAGRPVIEGARHSGYSNSFCR